VSWQKELLPQPNFCEVPGKIDPEHLVDAFNPMGPQAFLRLHQAYLENTVVVAVTHWKQPDRDVGPFTEPPVEVSTCKLWMDTYLDTSSHLVGGGNFGSRMMVRHVTEICYRIHSAAQLLRVIRNPHCRD
jgi:hypothetical protein